MGIWQQQYDPEGGSSYWVERGTGAIRTDDPRAQPGYFGDPWQRDRTGWTPENIDAIFNSIAKSEAGNVGAQTLATLRQYGVDPNVALDALWRSATESANPYWAGGSPTGISRGIWEKAGILPQVDTPQLRAQQGQEDHDIWAGQQQGGDDFGDILKIAALAAGAYFGGSALFGGLEGLSAGAGMTEAGWGFGPAGLGGDAAGAAAAATGGGASVNLNDYYSMLDEIQAGTNGVTAPNPTMSTPFGDIYGSGGDIAKSLLGNPSNLLKLLGGSTGSLDLSKLAGLTASGGADWGKILGGLIGYKMTDDLADKYFTKAGEIADKYKRPWDEWLPIARQMRDDPQGYINQYWKPMIGQFTDEAARKAAAGGFNNSGSGVNQIADTVTNRSIQSIFNPNYDANLKAAGLYQSPSTAAGIEGDLTSKGLGVVNQANSNLGFAAREATSGLLGGSRQSTDDIYNNIMKTFFA